MPDKFAICADLQDEVDDLIIRYGKDVVLAAVSASDSKDRGRPRIDDDPHLIAMAMMLESDPGTKRWAVARQIAFGLKDRPDDSAARRLCSKFKKNEPHYRRYARKLQRRAKVRDCICDLNSILSMYKSQLLSRLSGDPGHQLEAHERVKLERRISELGGMLESIRQLQANVFNCPPIEYIAPPAGGA